jgi:hypothetical protein
MNSFFEWLSELDNSTQLLLFMLVVFAIVIIPYLSLIKKYIIYLIRPETLRIDFFELESSPHVYVGEDIDGADLYAEIVGEGIFIDGCSAMLIWGVTGARSVEIKPLGKTLNGNSATVIINAEQLEYTLVAKGFNGKTITSTLRIPERDLYHLSVTPLGVLKPVGDDRSLTTASLTEFLPSTQSFSQAQPLVGSRATLIGPNVCHLNPEPVAVRSDKRRELHTALDKRRILAVYDFSTTKYNKKRHFFNETELDYSNTITQ